MAKPVAHLQNLQGCEKRRMTLFNASRASQGPGPIASGLWDCAYPCRPWRRSVRPQISTHNDLGLVLLILTFLQQPFRHSPLANTTCF